MAAARWVLVDTTELRWPGEAGEGWIIAEIGGKLVEAKQSAQDLFDAAPDVWRLELRAIESGKTKKVYERDIFTTSDPDPNGHELGIPESKKRAAGSSSGG